MRPPAARFTAPQPVATTTGAAAEFPRDGGSAIAAAVAGGAVSRPGRTADPAAHRD
jgi:hypothetical protein